MNHKLFILIPFLIYFSLPCTSNWSGSGASGNDDKQISFYGTLTTHQGQTETVDHLLIENKHNDIVMYDAPVRHAQEEFNTKTKQTEISLDANPVTDFVKSKIDLSTTKEIKVPSPTTIWVYQKEKKIQRQEFLLVQVTAKESSTPKDYLLEHKTRISCNRVAKNESQKQEVPLAAVETLTIEGYSFALSTEKKSVKKEVSAECPLIKSETETTTEVMEK